jgi:hypothetical protein
LSNLKISLKLLVFDFPLQEEPIKILMALVNLERLGHLEALEHLVEEEA